MLKWITPTAAALLLATASATAYAYESSPAAQAQPPQAASFERAEKEAFAAAFVEIDEIRNRYAASLEATQDQEQAMNIQQEANDAMVRAIEQRDLQVETYNAIATAAAHDEALRETLLSLIDAAQ